MVTKEKLYEYTFDYIGVRTIHAKNFEEAKKMADMEVPVDFSIEICDGDGPELDAIFGKRR
jgi:hypothetical protein